MSDIEREQLSNGEGDVAGRQLGHIWNLLVETGVLSRSVNKLRAILERSEHAGSMALLKERWGLFLP